MIFAVTNRDSHITITLKKMGTSSAFLSVPGVAIPSLRNNSPLWVKDEQPPVLHCVGKPRDGDHVKLWQGRWQGHPRV